jgi:hypothetical protein
MDFALSPGDLRGNPRTHGGVLPAISDGMVALLKEFYGHGPTRTKLLDLLRVQLLPRRHRGGPDDARDDAARKRRPKASTRGVWSVLNRAVAGPPGAPQVEVLAQQKRYTHTAQTYTRSLHSLARKRVTTELPTRSFVVMLAQTDCWFRSPRRETGAGTSCPGGSSFQAG